MSQCTLCTSPLQVCARLVPCAHCGSVCLLWIPWFPCAHCGSLGSVCSSSSAAERSVGETFLNDVSSRSHQIVRLVSKASVGGSEGPQHEKGNHRAARKRKWGKTVKGECRVGMQNEEPRLALGASCTLTREGTTPCLHVQTPFLVPFHFLALLVLFALADR